VIGEAGFDVDRLRSDPAFPLYSEAAVAALSGETAAPLRDLLAREDGPERSELAAFAVSSQGLAPLLSTLPDFPSLPADVAAFLVSERSASAARAARLRRTFRETVTLLRGAGVEAVALKGAALAFFHYPAPELRPMADLDLLLREPGDLRRATAALARAGWRSLFDTPRHRVFARPDERIARPATEDAGNPVRLELHVSFRLPVLGRVFDASPELRADAVVEDLDGVPVAIAGGPALFRHLVFHAAEDFAGNGIRGIQAHDFRLLARSSGKLRPEFSSREIATGAAPLSFAAAAVERLFPGTFDARFLTSLASRVPPELRARAAALPALRHTRPSRGWSRKLLSVTDGALPRARFLARTLFPTFGEVKANAAPEATGLALAAAWARVLLSRAGLRRRRGPR
jgi:hypothetical protein